MKADVLPKRPGKALATFCCVVAAMICLVPLLNWICLITNTSLCYNVLGVTPHWIHECRAVESTHFGPTYKFCWDVMNFLSASPSRLDCVPLAWISLPVFTWYANRKLLHASILWVVVSVGLVILFFISAFAPGPFEWFWA